MKQPDKIMKSLPKASLRTCKAGFNAAKTKIIDDMLAVIPYYCILKCIFRILIKFIHYLHTEPCRSRAEMLYKAILDVIEEKTADSIEEITLAILATLGLNLEPFWHILKPAICAFIKSIREDILRYHRDKNNNSEN